MIDIAVVGDAATEKWVARKEQKLGSEGLRCSFVDWKTDPAVFPRRISGWSTLVAWLPMRWNP